MLSILLLSWSRAILCGAKVVRFLSLHNPGIVLFAKIPQTSALFAMYWPALSLTNLIAIIHSLAPTAPLGRDNTLFGDPTFDQS